MTWRPTASYSILKKRADILKNIRAFFAERNILEVETPLLCSASVTDPHIASIPAIFKPIGSTQEQVMYLQTSPEYAMKRLLASGSGAIYQITKSFRQGEIGRLHNPEFTMLEWYRPGFDHHQLMNEMDDLLQFVLKTSPAERLSYGELFQKYLGIDPHSASVKELENCATKNNIQTAESFSDKNNWLDILLTNCIEPKIGQDRPFFLFDFPITQAALAKIRFEENPPVASRFEVYFRGVELANGFHELQDANEQRKRFQRDLTKRVELDLHPMPMDENFLAALEYGLPDCAGVALGIDRLMMLALENKTIADSMSFGFERV